FAGWFSVPSNARTDYVFFEGLSTNPNEIVSDVIVRVARVQGNGTEQFLGLLQLSTGAISGTFGGGTVTATVTQSDVGGTSREVHVSVATTNFSQVAVSCQVLTTVVAGTPPPPPNLPYPTRGVSHWFDNPFFAGRKYGDIIYEINNLPANCTVTDVELELIA